MSLFDIIALAVLGVSALVGFVRGFLREVTTIGALLIAALVAVYALRFVGRAARAAIHPGWLGDAAAIVIVFLIVYVILRVVSAGVIRSLHNTKGLGALDRLAGGGLGFGRGLIGLGLIYLAINLAPPASGLPTWITGARLYPLSAKCADAVRAIAPRGSQIARRLAPGIENAIKTGEGPANAQSDGGQSDESGYDHAAQKGLDDVAESSR